MKRISISIVEIEETTKRQKNWMRLIDESISGQYGYVEEELPFTSKTDLLQQTVDADQFDFKAVIKALNGI